MAMVEPEDRFQGAGDPEARRQQAEERCLDAEQRCFRAERRRFEAERQREQVQRLLAEARQAGLRMAQIVEELRRLVARMHEAAERQTPADAASAVPAGQGSSTLAQVLVSAQGDHDGDRMVDALTAAIARLRANVEAVGEAPLARPAAAVQAGHSSRVEDDPARAVKAVQRHPTHKHSLSWIARRRIERKQRKSG